MALTRPNRSPWMASQASAPALAERMALRVKATWAAASLLSA
jgi:hypothetical protein